MQTIKYLVQTIDCDYVCNFDYFAIYYENYITNRMNIIGDKLYLIVLCGLVNCQGKYYIRNSEYEINKRLQILSSGNMFAKDYIVNRNNNLCNKARKFFKYILEVVKFDFEVLDTNDPNDFLLGSKI
jgi:hypothetical protein